TLTTRSSCATSSRPPTPDSTPASISTPQPSSSSSSTTPDRFATHETYPPIPSLSQSHPALPRGTPRRLRMHALLVLARRSLSRRPHPLRPGTCLGHESRPRLQNEVRSQRRRSPRTIAQRRQLPARLRLPQRTTRTA